MGLKGYQVGGAKVSEKHAGFVINTGEATAADVCRLIGDIKARVMDEHGVEMETEIKMIGEF
jgi:UDP-N-acetylmuramate dehydrogenase